MQRGLAAPAGQRNIGLGLEQRLGHLDVPLLRGQVQGGVAAFVFAVYIDARGQVRFNRIDQPAFGR